MSLRRAVVLLTRRFSPRAPAGSLHSLRDLPIGGAAGVAAAALAGGGALAYFKKGPDDDESAARNKEEDMKARFEDWVKKYNRTYRDEEEKTMRFQVFKDTIKWIESQPPSAQENLLPENCFADLTKEELPSSRSCIDDIDDPDSEEYRENAEFLAKYEKEKEKQWYGSQP